MKIGYKRRLREFVDSRTDDAATAQKALNAWYKIADHAEWGNFGEMRQSSATASLVGDCVVFNVGGNKYRLIARLRYLTGRLYILAILDHRDYDLKDGKGRQRWIDDCGCFDPPPPYAAGP